MKRSLTILLLLISIAATAQNSDTIKPVKKRFWRASGELLLTELMPWTYNRFIRKAEFAKVNFKSIGNNLKPSSWEWDDNNFQTNQFGHPFHGNLYYSSFRSNGHSFWQSVPAAFVGSFLWEVAGETHKPAPNDFINTSLGGITLGEMTYRVSNKIVRHPASGLGRQGQEIVGFLINPLNGLNRIIDGKWGKREKDPDSSIVLRADLNAGIRRFGFRDMGNRSKGNNELLLRFRLIYGEKYKVSNIPFEHFYAQVEAGSGDSTYMNNIQVSGALKTWRFREDAKRLHLYSITLNYDFIKNNAFEYGGQGLTFKLLSDWSKHKKNKFRTEIGSGVTVLGAVPDNYLYYGEGRNYDYGPGIHVTATASLNLNGRLEAELYYKGFRFQTVNGNHSSFILNTISADIRANITPRFNISGGVGQYTLSGFYRDYPNVSEIYPFSRLSVGYRL